MVTWKGGVSNQRPILSTYCCIWDFRLPLGDVTLTRLRLRSRSKHLFWKVSFVLASDCASISNSEHETAEARECPRS